jgi:23S rRNA (adenine2503-C2)-methyltransferase
MRQLLGLTLPELQGLLAEWDQPRFRARQIFRWIYQELETDFLKMTDLPRSLRERLVAELDPEVVHPLHALRADDGLTEKALVELGRPRDQLLAGPLGDRRRRFNTVEAVLMAYPGPSPRRTVCVSSQAGCAMGCQFCATGQLGFVRDLTAGEILGQVLHFARRVRAIDGPTARLTNLVFMGQGEPFANFENVWRAVELLHAPEAFGLGARHITLSTVGVVPRIRELAEKPLQVNLAVSLHAANDDLRSRLVPLNRRYPLAEVIAACRDYVERTHRRVSFEWAVIRDVNDSLRDARELADLVRAEPGLLCHVNLIPLNATPGAQFQPPPRERIDAMVRLLEARGVPTTVRDTRGRQIDAACGQLRARLLETA